MTQYNLDAFMKGRYSRKLHKGDDKLCVDTSYYSDFQHDKRSENERSLLSVSEEDLAHTMMFSDKTIELPDYQKAIKSGSQFGRELYGKLYEDSPSLPSGKGVGWARESMRVLNQLPEFHRLKDQVKRDADLSALATAQLLGDVGEIIADIRDTENEEKPPQNPPGDGDGIGPIVPGNNPGDGNGNAEGEWQLSPDDTTKVRSEFRKCLKDVLDDINDTKDAMMGCGDAFSDPQNSDEDRTKMINELRGNKNLQEILKHAGRLLSIMDGLPVKTRECFEEYVDMELGRDIKRMLNQPKAYLSSPETEDMFFAKYIDETLEIAKLSGKEPLGRGNLILLVDESYSMEGARNDLARALSCAVLMMASREKRDVCVIGFNYQWTTKHILKAKDVRGIRMKNHDEEIAKQTKLAMMTDLAGRIASGGTSFDDPFIEGLNMNPNATNSDFIVITDGYADISEETTKRVNKAREDGMRVWVMLMGCNAHTSVRSVSDIVVDIEALSNSDDVDNTIAQILKNAKQK